MTAKMHYILRMALKDAIKRMEEAKSHLDWADEDHLDMAIIEYTNAKINLSNVVYKMKTEFGYRLHDREGVKAYDMLHLW